LAYIIFIEEFYPIARINDFSFA